MFKSLLSLVLIVFTSATVFSQTRIVPHVTAANGGFTTEIIIENASVASQNVTLQPYDNQGNALTAETFAVDGQAVLRGKSSDLLGEGVSHFTVNGSADVKVNVSYDFASGSSSPALVSESADQGTLWRMFPGNWDQIFDGLAIVNTGTEPVDVWLAQKNDQNEILKTLKIATGLAPNAKTLYVVGSPSVRDFTTDPSHFEISADQPLAVTALQGTLANDQINVLWSTVSRPLGTSSAKRDDRGVWFIEDGNLYDNMEMMGYMVAQDRLFQMEVFRRQARGTLGEIVSVNQISRIAEIDAFARQITYSEAERDEIFNNLDEETKMMIQGYVTGVNRRIGQVNALPEELLPLEFKLLGEDSVHPWTYHDVMEHIYTFQRGFSMRRNGAEQVENGALLQELTMKYGAEQGAMMFNDLRYLDDPESQTMIETQAKGHSSSKQEQPLPMLRDDLPDLTQGAYEFGARLTRIQQALKDHGILLKGGSYAWAVSGDLTESGKPMLYSGPQVGFGAPGVVMEGSIDSDALTVSGMAIPGIPGILVGRTPHHAWSMQIGFGHTWDYYLENESDIRVVRQETIKVKDGQDLVIDIEESDHGPILQKTNGMGFAFKDANRDYNFNLSKGLLNLARAQNMDEFGEAASYLAVTQHLCYVDKDANIAYWHSGRQPVRPAGDYRVPQGMLANQDVLEWDAANVMPLITERNPAKGYFAGWNNKPQPDFPNVSGTNGLGPFHRGHVIRDFFQTFDPNQKWSFDELRDLAIQISASGRWAEGGNPYSQIGEAVLNALNNNPTPERMAVATMIENYDGYTISGGPSMWPRGTDIEDASVLMDAMIPRLIAKTFDDERGATTDTLSNITRFLVFIHGLYDRGLNNSYDWYTNLEDPSAPQTSEAIILETIDELLVEFGPRPWGIDARPTINYPHVLFGNITALGITTPSPASRRATYAQCVEYDENGPTRIESFFQLGQSGTITGSAIAPVFDQNALNMKEDFENWTLRVFPPFQ